MQLKKIKPGVVYAEHGASEYQCDNGKPVIVLDPTIWEREHGYTSTTYRRAAGLPAGRPDRWSRRFRGVPVLVLDTTSDVDGQTLEAFTAAAKEVADQLADHTDGRPFNVDLPEIGGHKVSFDLLNPRDIRDEWTTYTEERKTRQEREAANNERARAAAEKRAADLAAAHARIASVLPEEKVLTRFGRIPERPMLSWVELADLLDRYADARP